MNHYKICNRQALADLFLRNDLVKPQYGVRMSEMCHMV